MSELGRDQTGKTANAEGATRAPSPFPPFFSGYRSEVWNQQGRRSLPVPKAKPRHARAATAWQMEATAAAAMIARLLR